MSGKSKVASGKAAQENDEQQLQAQLLAAKRLLAIRRAQESLLDFQRYRFPDPDAADDPDASTYEVTAQARLLCEVLEKVERGELLRVAVSIGPQLGKTEIISKGFPAWHQGRNPYKHLMLGTYNGDFAKDIGGEVREIMTSPQYKQVFPHFSFRTGSKAKDSMITHKGGRMNFIGREGAGSGKPADIIVIDDPIKDDKEAQSPTIRQAVWNWFNKVMLARAKTFTAIVIVHTRWHEDDLIGRLCDPEHPNYDPDLAKDWTYINIPAVVKDPELAKALGLTLELPTDARVIEQFGDVPMSSLWPERKSLPFLAAARKLDKAGFEALYMGRPTPDDGDYFKRVDLIGYEPGDLPKNLRYYGSSDHALTTAAENDATCLGCAGIDEDDTIWILPDLFWDRVETDQTVEEMLIKMKQYRPMVWWAEGENIQKGFGPFLRKRMAEDKVYCVIDPKTPTKDKKNRARAIQGRIQMHKVRFPKFAHWWPQAEAELLKFPNATHDDFVDFLGLFGIGLMEEIPASREGSRKVVPMTGTWGWFKARQKAEQRDAKIIKMRKGF